MAFNAGAIKATMRLDRTPFTQGLAQVRRQGQRFARNRWTATVDVNTRRARQQIRELRGELRNLGALSRHIDINANTGTAAEQLRRLQQQAAAMGQQAPNLGADVDTERASSQLRYLQRQVSGFGSSDATARVSVAGAVGAVEHTRRLREMLDTLDRTRARPRVNASSIEDAHDEASGLRRALMALGLMRVRPTVRLRVRGVAGAIASMTALEAAVKTLTGPQRIFLVVAGLAAAMGALSQLGSGLMAIVRGVGRATGVLVTLPAIIAAVVAGGLVMKAAFDGFGEALSEDAETAAAAMAELPPPAAAAARAIRGLRSSFDGVQEGIQAAFFSGLAPRLELLGDALLPAVGRGAVQVAAGLNSVAHSVLEFAGAAQTARDTETVLNNTAHAFSVLGPAAGYFLSALRDITAVGSEYLPAMARHITSAAQRFAEFIAHARETGRINLWIENGVQALRDLRDITRSTSEVFGGLFRGLRGNTAATTLGQVRDAMARLSATINGPEFQAGLRAFADLFRDQLARLAPVVDTFKLAFDALRSTIETLLTGSGKYFVSWATTILTVLTVLSPVLYAIAWVFDLLAPVLGVVGGALTLMGSALLVARVATVAFNGALTIMNALLNMNPIGLVVLALIALSAAVYYAWNNFDWFRNGVMAVWNALSAGALWLWENALSPVVNWAVAAWTGYLWPAIQWVGSAIGVVLGAIGSAAMWLWTNAISPVVGFIVTAWTTYLWPAIQWVVNLWTSNMATMWRAVQALWSTISPVLGWVVNLGFGLVSVGLSSLLNTWRSIFQAVGAVTRWLWSSVVSPVVGLIVGGWNNQLVPAIRWTRTQWDAVMNALAATVRWLWTSVVSPVLGWIVDRFVWLYGRYSHYRTLLTSVFTSIGGAIGTLRDRFRSAIDRMVEFGQNLLRSFRGVRDSVQGIFRSIANHARTPINWVINTVYNNGLRRVARSVLNAVGLSAIADRIPRADGIPAFATGGEVDPAGYVRGRGSGTSDEIMARLSNREFVVNARSTSRFRPMLEWINNQGRRGATAPPAEGPPAFNNGGLISNALGFARDAVAGGAQAALRKALDALGWSGWIRQLKSGPPIFKGAAGGAMDMVGSNLLSFLRKEDNKGGGGTGVVKQARRAKMNGSDADNDYTRAFGMRGLPWCAMFVSEMIKRAKAQKLYRNVRSAAVATFANSSMRSVGVGSGKPGDLAVYRGSGPSGWGHINIVTDPKRRESIGGNESNRIRTQYGYYSSAAKLMRPGLAQGGVPDEALRNILGQNYEQNTRSTTPADMQFYRVLAGLPAYAGGGTASGPSLVGESGPELVDFGSRGRVRSNEETSEVLAEAIVRAMERRGESGPGREQGGRTSGGVTIHGLATTEVLRRALHEAEVESARASQGAGRPGAPGRDRSGVMS